MKRVFAALTLLVYFAVSTGFMVSVHYCMDRFDSAQLGVSGSDKCEKCGMHKDGGCCHDVVRVVKLHASHMAADYFASVSAPATLLSQPVGLLSTPFNNFNRADKAIAHSPPLGEEDTYLQIGVFRI